MRPIVNVPEQDQATAIGSMHKKCGKDRTCGSGDMLVHRQTQMRSSQYFSTAVAGDVMKKLKTRQS